MSVLERVKLERVRRHVDLSLDISPGVTILLAPNGTGKTAFFEATELALTGAVRRLEDSRLTALVQDGALEARVTLEFDTGELSTSLPAREGAKAVLEGNRAGILGPHNLEAIPYLLRVTHLLDQRSEQWIVRLKAKAAGETLANLPISREVATAAAALRSAQNASSATRTEAAKVVTDLGEKLEVWSKLLDALRAAPASSGLLSLTELHARLVSAELVDPQRAVPTDVDGVAGVAAAADMSLVQEITAFEARHAKVVALAPATDAHRGTLDRIAAVTREQEIAQEEFDRLAVDLREAQTATRSARTALAAAEQAIAESRRARERITRRDAKSAELEANVQERAGLNARLAAAQQDAAERDHALSAARALFAHHRELDGLRAALVQEEATVDAARVALARIRTLDEELARLTTQTETCRASQVLAEQGRTDAGVTLMAAARAHAEAVGRHQSLAAAAEGMQAAIQEVQRLLPEKRGDCPVCGFEHGAAELHRRISAALQGIDPALAVAAATLNEALRTLESAQAHETEAARVERALRDAERELREREKALREERIHIAATPLLSDTDLSVADARLKDEASRVHMAKMALEAVRRDLPPVPRDTDLDDQGAITAAMAVQRLERAVTESITANARLQAELREIVEGEPPWERVLADAARLNDADGSLAAANAALDARRAVETATNAALDGARSRLSGVQRARDEETGHARMIETQWTAAGLVGRPDLAAHTDAVAASLAAIARAHQQREELTHVQAELARWRSTEAQRRTQQRVDELRGGASVEDYEAHLGAALDTARAASEQAARADEAMKLLARELDTQGAELLRIGRGIDPTWRALLRRVLREPLFDQTRLDRSISYRKERAEALVQVHGEPMIVDAVASEAQLTDLQLTLLLSMARTHRWSSWRCLLLDDPTQHHDLIAAAAVFDILRDYVASHGFQIILATHDALQARYFERMLRNDGLPVHLHTLA